MLGTGKSFRTSRDGDTVGNGSQLAVVRGQATVRAGIVDLACTIANGDRGTRKTYTVNGSSVRYASFLGTIRVVTFVPADLELAGGTPSARRAFLNVALAQGSRATTTSWRATVKRCSRRMRCCAARSRPTPSSRRSTIAR